MSDPAPVDVRALARRTLARNRRDVVLGVILLSLHQLAEALVPVAIGLTIDRAVVTGDVGVLALCVAGLLTLFTVLAFAYRVGARFTLRATENEAHLLRVEAARRALDPRGERSGLRTGEVLSVATSDAEQAALYVRAWAGLIAMTTAIVVTTVALLTIDVPLGVGVLVGVPVMMLLLRVPAAHITRRSEAKQATAAGATALATDLVGGLRVLMGMGAREAAAVRYRAASARALRASVSAAASNGVYRGVVSAASLLFLACVAAVSGWMALQGRLSIGELITVVGLAQFLAEPVQGLGMVGQIFATARASARRLVRLLDAPDAVAPGDRAPEGDAVVELADVTYRTLRGVDLRLEPGRTVGVLATDPRDAEALLELLSGRAAPTEVEGAVTVGGVPVHDLDLAALRAAVLVEEHGATLFEGTLRTNLATGTDRDEAHLSAALRAAGAQDLVTGHPDGLDRPITDRAANLSGGQRQRTALARALAADPPVLVLHDPTTAVDAVTEEAIARGVSALRAERVPVGATLVVTGSPALLARADEVVVLIDGRVRGRGTHADLVRDDPRYGEAVLR
ncbi:ABC transporter ATP-binding protein [Nocardiopsis sp. N85]|uniref:ABC transporter transmembrane domain-containing protein n=1 Tax=Nocardiopsis sp. N85 TaxID=3029400 RepID=UPI00237F58A0|nr:ABC transporter ATP-binding protein [Nocardiopsis sp. N85]MDE3721851.1 ABC transporter ATP-binding protein [Nocardiopsis sp. N85]